MEGVLDAEDITAEYKHKRKREEEETWGIGSIEDKKRMVSSSSSIMQSLVEHSWKAEALSVPELKDAPVEITAHVEGPSNGSSSQDCDWNEAYQILIDRAKNCSTFKEWTEANSDLQLQLQQLYQNFLSVAQSHAMQIVDDIDTPVDRKVLRPISTESGNPDSYKYIHRNIFFRLVHHSNSQTYRVAAAEAAQELKGYSTLIAAQVEGGGVYFPLKTIIDYKGHRVVATSMIRGLTVNKLEPVPPNVVGIGASGLPEHIKENIRQLAERANLKHQTIHLYAELFPSMSAEARFGDGKFYLTTLDFSKVLPPSDQHPEESPEEQKVYMQLRPELVAMNSSPLQSCAFSSYNLGSESEDKGEFKEATRRMWNDLIPTCAAFLEERIIQEREFVLSSAESDAVAYIDPGSSLSIQEILHNWGINTRYTGLVQAKVQDEFVKRVLSIEMIVRSMKEKLRNGMRNIGSNEDQCKKEASKMISYLFQTTEESKDFRSQLFKLMKEKYCGSSQTADEEYSLNSFLAEHYSPLLPRLLRRLQEVSGLILSTGTIRSIEDGEQSVEIQVEKIEPQCKPTNLNSTSNRTNGSLLFKQQVEIKVQQQGVLDKPDLYPVHFRAAREFGWELQYWASRSSDEIEAQQLLDRAIRCYRTLLAAQPNNMSTAARLLYCYISRCNYVSTSDEQKQYMGIIYKFTKTCIEELIRQKPHLSKSMLISAGLLLLDGGSRVGNVEIIFAASQFLFKMPFVHSNTALGMMHFQQTIARVEKKLRQTFPSEMQPDFLIKCRDELSRLLYQVEPSNYYSYLCYFAVIKSEMDYLSELNKGKELSEKLVNLWTGKVTLYLGKKEHDVALLRLMGYTLHLIHLQREDSPHMLHDLASRCFELALSYEPENIGVLIVFGETCVDFVGDNYGLLRHAITLFKRCLQSKDLISHAHLLSRIAHDLLSALLNPWNFYQNSHEAIQEFVSVADNLVPSLERPEHSIYMSLAQGYGLIAKLDVDQRFYYTLKQNQAMEQAYKLAVQDDAAARSGEISEREPRKLPLSDILELWGFVQEQLAEISAETGDTPSHHKWLLSSLKKYQEAILLDPASSGLHYKLGCGYASWLKAKVDSGAPENLTFENVWLKNAELSWTRALQCNPYLSDVYKQWADLFSFLHFKSQDPNFKLKFQHKAQEKAELQSKLEMISVQMMYSLHADMTAQ